MFREVGARGGVMDDPDDSDFFTSVENEEGERPSTTRSGQTFKKSTSRVEERSRDGVLSFPEV